MFRTPIVRTVIRIRFLIVTLVKKQINIEDYTILPFSSLFNIRIIFLDYNIIQG